MKRMFLSLGLSVTILLSAAFAQETMQKAVVAKNQNTSFLWRNHDAVKRVVSQDGKTIKKGQAPIRLKTAYKADHGGKVKIKLSVGNAWDDGTGYQLLLDKDTTLSNYILPTGGINQDTLRNVYSDAEYKIPSDASPTDASTVVVDLESDSTMVDPGWYDVLCLNPTPSGASIRVYVASNGVFNNILFEADYTYVFEPYLGYDGYDDVFLYGPYDLAVEGRIPLFGNYNQTSTNVKVTFVNTGTEPVSSFTVFYQLEGSEDSVKKTMNEPLQGLAKREITFDETISLAEDTVLNVLIGVLPRDKETVTANNTIEIPILKKSIVSAPFEFNLAEYDFISEKTEAWQFVYDEEDYPTGAAGTVIIGEPLVSRCLSLEANKAYRLTYEHMLGDLYWGFIPLPSTYYVLVGKVDTDIKDWDIVDIVENYTDDFEENIVTFDVKEAGTYAIAFVEDMESNGMALMNISIAEVPDYDARMLSLSGFPSMIPVEHANGTFHVSAVVENYGRLDIDKAVVSVSLKGQEVGKTELTAVKRDEKDTVDITLNITGLAKDEAIELTATVTIEGQTDQDLTNNSLKQKAIVTDDMMAYDYTTEDMYEEGVGSARTDIGCGIPFTLQKKDTLTGISIGWSSELDEDIAVILKVYKWNTEKNELGDMILNETVRRGTVGGQKDYTIPARILETGSYMIGVQQDGTNFYGLVCDGTPDGILYITTATPVAIQAGLGTPAIRAIFGHDGKPVAKDLAVKEISKPKDLGLFSNEEPIVVKVRNNGYEVVEAPLTVMVNKDNLPAQTVKLAAYAEAEYTFKGDLSAADAEFVLTATVALEGDENEENNTITRTVRSYPPIDPYKMDFEYCDDFAMDNELVGWKGVVGETDAAGSYGFEGVSFPNSGELFAFIAYNAALTSPVTEGGEAHGGERFGASFAWANTAGAVENNAWLVSPQLKLAEQDPCIKFFVRSFTDEYGLEKYNVLISTSDNKPESFVQLGETFEAPAEWTDVTVNLKEYSGKDVYLAIQCVSNDAFIFMIDDIMVTSNTATEGKAADVRLNAWPNPANEMVYISADQAIEQVCIYTPAGNLLYQSADNMNAEEFRYNVKNLNSGLYIARVKTAQGSGVVKFVVR